MVWDYDLSDRNQKDKFMSNIILNLEICELVIFPADKNNGFRSMRKKGTLLQYNIISNNHPKI